MIQKTYKRNNKETYSSSLHCQDNVPTNYTYFQLLNIKHLVTVSSSFFLIFSILISGTPNPLTGLLKTSLFLTQIYGSDHNNDVLPYSYEFPRSTII